MSIRINKFLSVSTMIVILVMAWGGTLAKQTDKKAYFLEYNKIINEAELAIVDNELSRASHLYSRFSLSQLKFRDLYNYGIVILERKDNEMFKLIYNEMKKRGVQESFFKSAAFENVRTQLNSTLFSKPTDSSFLSRSHNKTLVDGLDSLLSLDQVIFSNRFENKASGYLSDSLTEINDNNMEFQLSLIQQFGFPSECTLGPRIIQDTVFSNYSDYLFVPIHCLQMSRDTDLIERCKKTYLDAFFDGSIDLLSFSLILEATRIDSPAKLGTQVYCVYKSDLYKNIDLSDQEMLVIDSYRAKYGCSSLADQEKKLKFQLIKKNKKYRFQLMYIFLPDKSHDRFNRIAHSYKKIFSLGDF